MITIRHDIEVHAKLSNGTTQVIRTGLTETEAMALAMQISKEAFQRGSSSVLLPVVR